jgi:hypothetical protein
MPLAAVDSTSTRESLARYVLGLFLEVVRSRLGTARELAGDAGGRSVEFTGPAGHPVRVHLAERPWRLSSVARTRPDDLYGEVTDSAEFVGHHDRDDDHRVFGSPVAFACPNDSATSDATIAAATARLGQKPVRYLIASHTHPDHGGGLRGYHARGATLMAAAGHGAFFRRLARTEAASIEPLGPGDRRVLEDGDQRVVLHNVGPSPHSVETVIGYLPEQRLLWQVDLFLVPMTGSGSTPRPVTDWLAGEITRLGLDVGWIIDTHTGMVYPRSRFDAAVRGAGRRAQGGNAVLAAEPDTHGHQNRSIGDREQVAHRAVGVPVRVGVGAEEIEDLAPELDSPPAVRHQTIDDGRRG